MKVLTQKKLDDWLTILLQDTIVATPVEAQGKLVYRRIDEASQVIWGFERTDMSPKTWLFPMTEPILFIEQGPETKLKEPQKPQPVALFGIRPCDALSLLAFDALFLDKAPADPQYKRHRESTTLIGISCPQMWESCFCTAVGGAPNSSDGLDILLTAIEEGYAVKILTEKGKEISANLPFEEKDISLQDPKLIEGLPTLRKSDEWMALFNDLYWEQLSNSCISLSDMPMF